MDPERWRDVAGYEGQYQISDYGRVKSVARMVGYTRLFDSIMGQFTHYKGHKYIFLSKDNVKQKYFVHILVAEAFIVNPHPIKYRLVNHRDGCKVNNHYLNLEWTSTAANTQHYYDGVRRMEIREEGM